MAVNYDAAATVDDGSCIFNIDPACVGKRGCTYSIATNYDVDAEVDDGSCEFPSRR